MEKLDWAFLGTVPYKQAMQIQYSCAQEVASGAPPKLIMLQHPPTITLGRQADESNLKLSSDEYVKQGIEVFRVLRGGDVTYHGPGQLVFYPIASLKSFSCSVPDWVKGHAQAIVRFLSLYGISGSWSDTHPGVWIENKKIAALGFHISRGISTHGAALNIAPDLSGFNTIIPCGLGHFGVTSLEELGIKVQSLAVIAQELATCIAEVFGVSLGTECNKKELIELNNAGSELYATAQ
jgi:lipoyl(octanoyl) transferase